MIITYKEWLRNISFKIKQKYKVDEVIVDGMGMMINFISGFHYGINERGLKNMYENSGFEALCEDIEREYISRIMNF